MLQKLCKRLGALSLLVLAGHSAWADQSAMVYYRDHYNEVKSVAVAIDSNFKIVDAGDYNGKIFYDIKSKDEGIDGVNDFTIRVYTTLAVELPEADGDGEPKPCPFELQGDKLVFDNVAELMSVTVYRIDGTQIKAVKLPQGSSYSLDLSVYATGMYLVKANNTTYKIVIR